MFTYHPFVSTPSVILRQPDTVRLAIASRIIADFIFTHRLIDCVILIRQLADYFPFTLCYGLLTDFEELQHKRRRLNCLRIFRLNGKLDGLDFLLLMGHQLDNMHLMAHE